MTISQAIECGCARKEHREITDVDIVGNPELFQDPPVAVVGYLSTKTTNCERHPVRHMSYNTSERHLTPECSLRILPDKTMSMGHTSDGRLFHSVAVTLQATEPSSYCMFESGCATRFGSVFSETQVAMTEMAVCKVCNLTFSSG